MTRNHILFAAALLVFLAGCVRSLHPLYTEEDLVFNPALVGTWEDDGETWEFSKGDENNYGLVLTDGEGKRGSFIVHLVEIEGELFLDLFPDDPEMKQTAFYQIHLIPVHTILHVVQIEPTLQLRVPDLDWMDKLLKADPGAIKHEIVDDQIILTAGPEELQAFWLKAVKDEDAWGEPTDMPRASAADGATQEPED